MRKSWILKLDSGPASPHPRAGAGEGAPPGHAPVVAGEDDDPGERAERNFLDDLNPDSKRVIEAWVEPALADASAEARFQFERSGYFVADALAHRAGAPVFNRTLTLKDSWTTRAK